MSEQVVRPLGRENISNERIRSFGRELLTRRNFLLKAAAGLGVAAVGATGVRQVAIPRIRETYEKYSSLSGPFTNYWDFVHGVGAEKIDRARLDELLGGDPDATPVYMERVSAEKQSDPDAIAEYDLVPEGDGPVHIDFDGLYGDDISLNVLRAVVDDEEEFFIPLIRDDIDQPPVSIQLGHLSGDAHKLQLFHEHGPTPISADELSFRASQESPDTLRSFINAHQPDLYLRDYDRIANNFPRRSYAAVFEIPSGGIAVVYTTETTDEDQKFGIDRLGTSVAQLDKTKGRPTDKDWGIVVVISHDDGRITDGIISEPYHNTQDLPIGRGGQSERTLVRIASENNNVKRVDIDDSAAGRAKVRLLPTIGTYDEINAMLYSTDQSTARLGICENYFEGKIDPDDEYHAFMIEKYDVDLRRCKR